METLSEIDWARLAAFIDGEGCIAIAHVANKYTCVRIQIVNTDRRLVDWCKDSFGGFTQTRHHKNPKHKPSYTWTVASRSAGVVIKGCFPYLLLKQEQARVALEFLTTINFSHGKLTTEDREHREKLRIRMHELNKRGRQEGIHAVA
jgi:hypothetical protein